MTTAKQFLTVTFLTLCFFLLNIPGVEAQYFGRNNVLYEDFDFQVLHTPNFDIYHYPQEATAVTDIGQISERWYLRFSNLLLHAFNDRNPLVVYANHADFQQNRIVPNVGVSTSGVTEGRLNRVILPIAESNQSTNHVLGHEIVHAFQYDIAKNTDTISGLQATSILPLWFVEGMAEYLSIGPADTHTAMWLRDAVLQNDLPELSDLSNTAEYFPYRFGHSVWSFIAGQWGDSMVPVMYRYSLRGGVDMAVDSTLGISTDSLSTLWRNAVIKRYDEEIQSRNNPEETGELILGEENGTGSMNIGPVLSPDGDQVVFISERDLFSMELFLADAHTGEIQQKLSSTSTDPHLTALKFVESAGTWSPDGERFAAVVFSRGDNEIVIIDIRNGSIRQNLAFEEVDAITNPAWSPDGNRLAFSGSSSGYSNLYLYHLEEDSLEQLTDDKHSDLQPDWSPDGQRIVFMSDRGAGTNLDDLVFDQPVIRTLNLNTRQIEAIPEFKQAKHINPRFSPDGRSLFYISDPDGFSNVYRYDFGTEEISQVTNVNTAVSGISQYSPAMSISTDSGDMMVTVFQNSNYNVYRIPADQTTGTEVEISTPFAATPGLLPPATGEGNQMVSYYLTNPVTQLPSENGFELSDYSPRFRLTAIAGGAGIGVSNQMGVGTAGGITIQFSDMLNQHQLTATVNAQDTFKDTGGGLMYLNQNQRFLYGLSVSHTPFRSTFAGITEDTLQVNGDEAIVPVAERVNRRTFQEQISVLGLYPFSTTRRMEMSAGFSHIWYDTEMVRTFYSQQGQAFDRNTFGLDSPPALNMYNASLAYVEDNSLSAFTGPIRGHRLRLDLQQTTGALTFLTALADLRQYTYLRSFTLAFRFIHLARYLEDAEDNRLSPNFIGQRTLVRGYNYNSFSSGECTDAPGEGCAVFDRLTGSKIAVANVEFRIPVLGAEDLALFRTNVIPMTLSPFFDAGYAWNQDNHFSFDDLTWTTGRTSERIPVFSAGASLRVNILGFLITELYYAIPFQRPDKNGFLGFTISPGW